MKRIILLTISMAFCFIGILCGFLVANKNEQSGGHYPSGSDLPLFAFSDNSRGELSAKSYIQALEYYLRLNCAQTVVNADTAETDAQTDESTRQTEHTEKQPANQTSSDVSIVSGETVKLPEKEEKSDTTEAQKETKQPTYSDLKIYCVGASLTSFAKIEHNYPYYLAQELGSTVVNCGISGRTMARDAGSDYGSDVYSKVTGDFDSSVPESRRYVYNFSDADVIIIQCCSNDLTKGIPLYDDGCADSPLESISGDSYYGALNSIAATLKEKYPNKLIIFTSFIDNKETTLNIYSTRMAFNKATREVAEKYKIPYLDYMSDFAVRNDKLDALVSDGILYSDKMHLDERGCELYAKKAAEFIRGKIKLDD